MTHPDLSAAESYPTFWDAIPVDPVTPATARPAAIADRPGAAPSAFSTATGDEPIPVTLFVEQTDVG